MRSPRLGKHIVGRKHIVRWQLIFEQFIVKQLVFKQLVFQQLRRRFDQQFVQRRFVIWFFKWWLDGRINFWQFGWLIEHFGRLDQHLIDRRVQHQLDQRWLDINQQFVRRDHVEFDVGRINERRINLVNIVRWLDFEYIDVGRLILIHRRNNFRRQHDIVNWGHVNRRYIVGRQHIDRRVDGCSRTS
jgi:hypothetical protein